MFGCEATTRCTYCAQLASLAQDRYPPPASPVPLHRCPSGPPFSAMRKSRDAVVCVMLCIAGCESANSRCSGAVGGRSCVGGSQLGKRHTPIASKQAQARRDQQHFTSLKHIGNSRKERFTTLRRRRNKADPVIEGATGILSEHILKTLHRPNRIFWPCAKPTTDHVRLATRLASLPDLPLLSVNCIITFPRTQNLHQCATQHSGHHLFDPRHRGTRARALPLGCTTIAAISVSGGKCRASSIAGSIAWTAKTGDGLCWRCTTAQEQGRRSCARWRSVRED